MSRNLDKFLESMAKQVRDWVEDEDLKRVRPTREMEGFCGIATGEFSRRLYREKIPHEIHLSSGETGSHIFPVIFDYVYDVTATQFKEYRNTKVVIKHVKEAEVNWFHQSIQVFRNVEELRKFQIKEGWPKNQTAYAT